MQVKDPCPYCGIELTSMNTEWKKIHINGCYASTNPQALQQCPYIDCPYCGEHLGKISYVIGMEHISNCSQSPVSSQPTSSFQLSQPEIIDNNQGSQTSNNSHYGTIISICSLDCIPDISFVNSP